MSMLICCAGCWRFEMAGILTLGRRFTLPYSRVSSRVLVMERARKEKKLSWLLLNFSCSLLLIKKFI